MPITLEPLATDIVERIRNRPGGSLCFENESCHLLDLAADEIERLREELAKRLANGPTYC
jgi:hypothetical protein